MPTLKEQLEELNTVTLHSVKTMDNVSDLDLIKTTVLGKKGSLTDILKGVKHLSAEEKPMIGQLANTIKRTLLKEIDAAKKRLKNRQVNDELLSDTTDPTLPSIQAKVGKQHPINQTIDYLTSLFNQLGFSVEEGVDIENDFYNFEALNIPENHPARDMHDTFYLKSGHVLRTHTSPAQIHIMENNAPPLKFIVPGKVYRCDTDASHSPVFHQIEGLYVDKKVTFGDLKGTLEFFLHALFGKNKAIRFRPSYFPFTEPSTEVDVECFQCQGKGCNLCKNTGWLEILGAGMVNNKVFNHIQTKYKENYRSATGFAFGLGVERIAMLLFGITDIRLFYENDVRFLSQF